MSPKWKYGLLTAITVTATAIAALAGSGTSSAAATAYTDVPPVHWAYNAVQWASQNGIMTGPGGRSIFDIAGIVNRAQLATVLMRQNNIVAKQMTDLQVRIDLLEDRVRALERNGGSSSSSRSISASATFSATLSARQETGDVTSNGSGQASFAINGDDLTFDVTVSGLTTPITAAHFHRGAAGVSGPVLHAISFSGNHATGTWSNMTAQDIDDLFAGRLYVNVHTTRYPDGEVRGQVTLTSGSASSASVGASSSRSSSLSSSSSSSSSMSSSSSSLSSSSLSSSSVSSPSSSSSSSFSS